MQAKKGNLSKILQRVFLSLLYIGENHENHGEIKRCVLGKKRLECFGIIGMAAISMKDGLVKLLRIDSLKHGISVKITDDNKIRLNFHVIVAYGVNISTIADNLVNNVKYKVEAFTGMEIEKINIMVEGVRAID